MRMKGTSVGKSGWLKLAVIVAFFDALQRFFALGYGVLQLRKDSLGYWMLGERFRQGDFLLSNPLEVFRPPLYPVFLAISQWIHPSGGVQIAVHLQQVIGFLACIFLAFSIYQFTKSIRAAVLTYIMIVAATAPICFGVRIMSEGMFLPFLILFLGSYLRSLSNDAKFSLWYVVCGFALGCATLMRAASHYLIPGLFVPVIIEMILQHPSRTKIREQLVLPLTITIMTLVTIIPWMARGYSIVGEPFLTQATGRYLWNSSFNKKTANLNFPSDLLTTRTLKFVSTYEPAADLRHDYEVHTTLVKSGVSPFEADKRMQQIAIKAIRLQPLIFAKSVLIRAKIFWYTTCQETLSPEESREPDPISGQQSGFVHWKSVVFETLLLRTRLAGPVFHLLFSIATLAALAALVFSGQRNRNFGILGMNICFFYCFATSLLSVPYCRYRMILLPVSASAIAIALDRILEWRKARLTTSSGKLLNGQVL